MIQPRLREWAREELPKLGISQREMAKRMKISPSRITDLMAHDDRRIGWEVCEALAKMTRTPVHNVLEMADLIPSGPPETAATRFLAYIYNQLDERGKKDLVAFAEHLRDRNEMRLPD